MMRYWLIALFSSLLLTPTAFAQSSAELDKGEIFVSTQSVKGYDFPRLVVRAVVDAPPQKVFEIVGNCDRFKDRLPRVKKSRILKKSAASYTCTVTIGVPFPMSDLIAVTVDRRRLGPEVWERKWTLASGAETSYTRNVGGFTLSPFKGNPNRTLVHYEIHAIPKSAVPDFVRKSAQKRSLPGMIKRIRKEVAKL